MLIHEIVGTRKGRTADRKQVELNTFNDARPDAPDDEAPRIQGSITLEASREKLAEIFGEDYDVGQQYELGDITFTRLEAEPEA